MSTMFTVQVEASNPDGTVWQAVNQAETIDPSAWGGDWSAQEVAETTAANQTVAEGTNWRVQVWAGADADTSTDPDATFIPQWTAEVDVVSGTIEIANQAGDAPIIGGALTSGTTIEPWGVNETSMDRADEALKDLGLARTSDWTQGWNTQLWFCCVTAA